MTGYDPELDSLRAYTLCVDLAREGDERLRAVFAGAAADPVARNGYRPWSPVEIEALRLYVRNGYPPAQCARFLGRSEGAVEVRIRRCQRRDSGWPHLVWGGA